MLFSDRPDWLRMAVRFTVDAHGGSIADYSGPGVQVALPGAVDRRLTLISVLRDMGAEIRGGSRHWFPACNGEPESQWRFKEHTPADHRTRTSAYVEFATFDWAR